MYKHKYAHTHTDIYIYIHASLGLYPKIQCFILDIAIEHHLSTGSSQVRQVAPGLEESHLPPARAAGAGGRAGAGAAELGSPQGLGGGWMAGVHGKSWRIRWRIDFY